MAIDIGAKFLFLRTIEIEDEQLVSLTVYNEVSDPDDDNIDMSAQLKDGRSFGFTVFSIRNLQRLMEGHLSFVSPVMLVVSRLTDESLIDAARKAASLGIEHFGILQTGLDEE